MKKYIFVEAICIVLTLLFVVSSVSKEKITTKTADEITGEIISLFCDDTLENRDSLFIKESFGIDTDIFSSVSYYSSDDVMNVSEIFVGVLKDNNQDSMEELFIDYQTDKYNLFNGYAPEQAAWLSSFVYDEASGAVIFIVAENADEIYSAFLSAAE